MSLPGKIKMLACWCWNIYLFETSMFHEIWKSETHCCRSSPAPTSRWAAVNSSFCRFPSWQNVAWALVTAVAACTDGRLTALGLDVALPTARVPLWFVLHGFVCFITKITCAHLKVYCCCYFILRQDLVKRARLSSNSWSFCLRFQSVVFRHWSYYTGHL